MDGHFNAPVLFPSGSKHLRWMLEGNKDAALLMVATMYVKTNCMEELAIHF